MICTYVDCTAEAVRFPEDGSPGFALCEDHSQQMDELVEAGDVKKVLGFWVRAQGGAKKATERMQPSIKAAAKLFTALKR